MPDADTSRSLTLVDGDKTMVFDHDDMTEMLNVAMAPTAIACGVRRLLYAEDITRLEAAPPSVMAVTVGCEHGAAFLRVRRRSWLSKSGHGTTYMGHDLVYDPDLSTSFPTDAVLPLVRLRRIALEYLERGRRPAAYLWQPAPAPLPW